MSDNSTNMGGVSQPPPVTVVELLKKTPGFAKKNYKPFCTMFGLTLASPISQENFKKHLKDWRAKQPKTPRKSDTSKKKANKKTQATVSEATQKATPKPRYEVVDCVIHAGRNKRFHPGDVLPENFPHAEIERLVAMGKLKHV